MLYPLCWQSMMALLLFNEASEIVNCILLQIQCNYTLNPIQADGKIGIY